MGGGADLAALLRSLSPRLDPEPCGYVTLPPGTPLPVGPDDPALLALVREEEGLTLVLRLPVAERAGLPVLFRAERITLAVESDLAGIGLTAAVSAALAGAGIACHMLAGTHHDHLLVPQGQGARALSLLRALQAGAGR